VLGPGSLMNKPHKNIIVLLIVIILLPVFVLSFYQISSLDNTEKNIEEVYNNELTAILSSVNEYVYDYVDDLAREVKLMAVEQGGGSTNTFSDISKKFIQQNNSIRLIMLADTDLTQEPAVISFHSDSVAKNFKEEVKDLLSLNKNKIKFLLNGDKENLKTIESISDKRIGDESLIIFLLKSPGGRNQICGLLIDSGIFINQILFDKINEIARGDFFITVTNIRKLEKNGQTRDNVTFRNGHNSAVNLFPNYILSIKLKGNDINSLIKSRTIKNLILILAINVFIIIGVWFVLRNFRKEKELMKLQSDFVSIVSHELRTPLSLISLFSETLMLEKITDDKKKSEYYKIINDESSRLTRIVDKILNFYSLEENGKRYNFISENLNVIIENILVMYKNHLDNNKFTVIFKPASFLPEILADSDAITEAVINLLDNAMKYSWDKKEIAISTGADKNYVFIKVKDYGVGISTVNQKKIFNKFFRIKDGSERDIKGAGLGLTIVKDIMKAHHGKVSVESSLGNGSCFTLKFFNRNID